MTMPKRAAHTPRRPSFKQTPRWMMLLENGFLCNLTDEALTGFVRLVKLCSKSCKTDKTNR